MNDRAGLISAARARSVAELVSACEAGAQPTYLHFWGHQPRPDGRLGPPCLSQWWPAPFAREQERFATAEHYMMWRKASLFGDDDNAREILRAGSPGAAKALGRGIRGFSEGIWVAHRWEIVVTASVAKFGSDPALQDYLISTGDRVLVEASPLDRVWGIGLAADHPDASVPQKWPGLNLLGFALMEARHQLAAAGATQP